MLPIYLGRSLLLYKDFCFPHITKNLLKGRWAGSPGQPSV